MVVAICVLLFLVIFLAIMWWAAQCAATDKHVKFQKLSTHNADLQKRIDSLESRLAAEFLGRRSVGREFRLLMDAFASDRAAVQKACESLMLGHDEAFEQIKRAMVVAGKFDPPEKKSENASCTCSPGNGCVQRAAPTEPARPTQGEG